MDRNTITGLLLIGLILIGYTYFFPADKPAPEKDKTEQTGDGGPVGAGKAKDDAQQREALKKEKKRPLPQGLEADTIGADVEVLLENEHLQIKLGTRGGRPVYGEIKNYQTYSKKPLILFEKDDWEFNYVIPTETGDLNTEDIIFTTDTTLVVVEGDDSAVVVLRADLGNNRSIEQVYTIYGNSYMIGYKLRLNGLEEIIPRSVRDIQLTWNARLRKQEKDIADERMLTTIWHKPINEEPDYLSESGDDQLTPESRLKWVSFRQKFFTQTIIAENYFTSGDLQVIGEPDSGLKQLNSTILIPLANTGGSLDMKFVFSPIHYATLAQYDLRLERMVELGVFIFRWINKYIVLTIFNLLNNVTASFGLIILLMTILIKVLLLPFTYKSYLSMAKMKLLKDDIAALKEKFGGDMARMQGEQMKLYQKTGVSPFGGCLPMLLQMPFLIALYRFFPASIELRQEPFLWAEDLSTYDSILNLPFDIPFYGAHVSGFTLLMAISTVFYTIMNRSATPQQAEMKFLPYITPVFLLVFFNSYSAALSYYYLLYNVLSITQQYIFKFFVDEDKMREKIEARKKQPVKKSSWQQKLENMAKKQREIQSKKGK